VTGCTACGTEIVATLRFCPWCGHVQRRKLAEFFRPHGNSPGRALRARLAGFLRKGAAQPLETQV
jgi:hypothetical protein